MIRTRPSRHSTLLALCALGGFLLTGRGLAAPVFAPNYAHAPDMVHLLHWERFPIRVYFRTSSAFTEERRKSALAGFAQWVLATGGVVRYEEVAVPAKADLLVQFDRDTWVPRQPGTAGSTSLYFSKLQIRKAEMELGTGRATPDQLQTTAAHEFGHALGIDGHSDDPDDLMCAVTIRSYSSALMLYPEPPRGITERDLNTLKTAYGTLFAPKPAGKIGAMP